MIDDQLELVHSETVVQERRSERRDCVTELCERLLICELYSKKHVKDARLELASLCKRSLLQL